jgi:hypothetical protein
MKKVLMFLAVLPVMASAQISEGVDTLVINDIEVQGINLNTAIKTGSQLQLIVPSCFYPCTTTITSCDLISFPNLLMTCSCPCIEGYAIGTSQPFYIAKQNFTSMNLSKSLNLNDTALFSKVDTVDSTGLECTPISKTVSGNVSSTCLLPYEESFGGRNGAGTIDTEQVWVLVTSQQKYAMVRVTPFNKTVMSNCELGGPIYKQYTTNGGTALHWYIQNNGTLDFSGVDQSAVLPHNANPILRVASQNQRYRVGLASSITNRQISEVYTLEGKRIDAGALKKMNELVIYR